MRAYLAISMMILFTILNRQKINKLQNSFVIISIFIIIVEAIKNNNLQILPIIISDCVTIGAIHCSGRNLQESTGK